MKNKVNENYNRTVNCEQGITIGRDVDTTIANAIPLNIIYQHSLFYYYSQTLNNVEISDDLYAYYVTVIELTDT